MVMFQALHKWASAVIILTLTGLLSCSGIESTQEDSKSELIAPSASAIASPRTASPTSQSSPSVQGDPWQSAIRTATSAAHLSQSAQSNDDWDLVGGRWQLAIAQLKSVPLNHPNYAQVPDKIAEYQNYLAIAETQAGRPIPQVTITSTRVLESLDGTGAAASSPNASSASPLESAKVENPASNATGQNSRGATNDPAPATPESSGTSAEMALAQHLRQTGATMYGAYWCPYCNRQEALFGDAVSQLNIVECDPRGENARPDLCRQAGVTSFPTWQINGQTVRGLMSLEELAELSGYQGDRNFGS